jgi:hypothetical protein
LGGAVGIQVPAGAQVAKVVYGEFGPGGASGVSALP